MSSKADQFAGQFEAVNDEVMSMVNAISDEQWRQPCACEGWPVGVVAHHIAEVNGAFARIVEKLVAGETYSPNVSMDAVHQSNADHAREFAAVGKSETIEALQSSGAAVLRQLRHLSDDRLGRTAGVFGGHEMSMSQVVEWVVIGHAAEHLASLRATVADGASRVAD